MHVVSGRGARAAGVKLQLGGDAGLRHLLGPTGVRHQRRHLRQQVSAAGTAGCVTPLSTLASPN